MQGKWWTDFTLLCLMVLGLSQLSYAQACDNTQLIQICDLNRTTTFALNSPVPTILGSVEFSVISRRPQTQNRYKETNYKVTVIERNSGQYTLTSQNNDEIPVVLNYSSLSNSTLVELTHGQNSKILKGSINFESASISFSLATPTVQPPPGVYVGSFEITLRESGCGQSCLEIIGLFDVELVVDPSIRISGLEDMLLNFPANTATQTFCVFASAGLDFGIRAESLNGSGEFLLLGSGGTGDTVTYQASSGEVGTALTPLTEGIATLDQGISWPGNSSQDCAIGGENMELLISVDPAALNNAIESNYTDTLTLTVELQ